MNSYPGVRPATRKDHYCRSCRRDAGASTLLFVFLLFAAIANAIEVQPVLQFPETGMDDPARYKDYTTRFYRDSSKNALQIYLKQDSGRVVNLWADAANESLSFTARDASGKPAPLQWCSPAATVTTTGSTRFVEYSLCTSSSAIEIGHLLLGSMRKERDFQYNQKDLSAYGSEPFYEPEILQLIANLEKLPAEEKSRELEILRAKNSDELRSRMDPHNRSIQNGVSVEQISFDGKNHLSLEITSTSAEFSQQPRKISIRSKASLRLQIKVGTDSTALTPLDQAEIFNQQFFDFYNSMKKQATTSSQASVNFRWLDREVRGMELVCYQEKLMAGLPNFATYFGRDTMMSALMFEPVWSVSMMEHAISSVLRKLSPTGEASHEEALGGQAIRENAGEYNKIIEQYLKQTDAALLAQGRDILSNLQRTRENYKMIDDDFQLPVLLGHYLSNPEIPAAQKRNFLNSSLTKGAPSRLNLLLKNFAHVLEATQPYAEHPDALHLVSFPKLEDGKWMSASWRDSGPGYGGGRFAMDVNVIWVPKALEAIAGTMDYVPPASRRQLHAENITKAIQTWRNSSQHFWVKMNRAEVLQKVKAKIESLPTEEHDYWKPILAKTEVPEKLEFLALSLDENGKPIPVLNTDPATLLFLDQAADAERLAKTFVLPYPVGLFVANLGPLCANDSYASTQIWQNFEKDRYHSPRVVWGREVNLITLGLVKHINAGKAAALMSVLDKTRAAVEASGLKHNELWSYEIKDGKLMPIRYGTSSDVQLWNLTDLSIQFNTRKK